jgi:hypothetical protein
VRPDDFCAFGGIAEIVLGLSNWRKSFKMLLKLLKTQKNTRGVQHRKYLCLLSLIMPIEL